MGLDVEQLKSNVQRRLADKPAVIAILLFGSHAVGRGGALADVDYRAINCARFGQEGEEVYIAVVGELLDLSPGEEVDVVLLNDAPPALQYRVFRDGILLLCLDEKRLRIQSTSDQHASRFQARIGSPSSARPGSRLPRELTAWTEPSSPRV